MMRVTRETHPSHKSFFLHFCTYSVNSRVQKQWPRACTVMSSVLPASDIPRVYVCRDGARALSRIFA